jgi:hypothetical protein
MGPCPVCGADRLIPLSFRVSRLAAPDEERPEVEAMRPVAICGGCGARIYPEEFKEFTGKRALRERSSN